MFWNYLKVAARNLLKYKTYALVNLLGLTLGISATLLTSLYVIDEFSFDKYHEKSERLYRVILTYNNSEQGLRSFARSPFPMGAALVADFPEIGNFTRLFLSGRADITHEENEYYEPFLQVDSSLFDLFDFEFIQGDSAKALLSNNDVILSQRGVEKYFGNQNPMGKVLTSNRGEFQVAAVIENPPLNSHLQFDALFFMPEEQEFNRRLGNNEWTFNGFVTYIEVTEGTNISALESQFPAFLQRHLAQQGRETLILSLQPVSDIHFNSAEIESGINNSPGNVGAVVVTMAVAAFVLIIACINYMNLATARSLNRNTEIGLRKSLGAQRSELAWQFLCESLVITLLALLIGLLVMGLLLPAFNSLSGKGFVILDILDPSLLMVMLLIVAFTTLVSGSYPAFYLSNIHTVVALKGGSRTGTAHSRVRQFLVTAQFCLSTILIIATLVVMQQLDYVRSKPLGFDKDNLVIVDINSRRSREGADAIKNRFLSHPSVKKVSVSSRVPGDRQVIPEIEIAEISNIKGAVKKAAIDLQKANIIGIDADFLEVFNIELIAGRNFSAASENHGFLVNQRTVEVMGWDEPLGKVLLLRQTNRQGEVFNVASQIIGVVKDFHFLSLYEELTPLVLVPQVVPVDPIDYFSVRIDGMDVQSSLQALESLQAEVDPSTPFDFNLLDDQIARFYQAEQATVMLFVIVSILAIVIACLGLFGLTAFAIEQRSKEIGVRKVLGATVTSIVSLLSLDFVKLALIANVIAAPVSYYLMSRWLENFAYHDGPRPEVFVAVTVVILLLTLLTVSNQAIKIARRNPVLSLRYE